MIRPTKDNYTQDILKEDHTCFYCGHCDKLKKFFDGSWKQGNDIYITFRCPVCGSHNGRTNALMRILGNDLQNELLNFLRNSGKKEYKDLTVDNG